MNNDINYYHMLFKGLVFGFICLCLKSCMNSVARADYYSYTDYNSGGTPQTVNVMPTCIPNTYTVHPMGDSSSEPRTVQIMPTGMDNMFIVHPVGGDSSEPTTVQIIRKY